MGNFEHQLVAWVSGHGITVGFVTWLTGNVVATLPTPGPNSPGVYKWFFSFATLVGSSLPRSLPKLRIPTPPEGPEVTPTPQVSK